MAKKKEEQRNSEFRDNEDLRELAIKIRDRREDVAHIDVDEILFLSELETQPDSAAKTFNLQTHPMQYFTNHKYCIVFYETNIDYMSLAQRAILMYHELLHIPAIGRKLVDHDVKDFYDVLSLSVNWNQRGADVPLICDGLEEEDDVGKIESA